MLPITAAESPLLTPRIPCDIEIQAGSFYEAVALPLQVPGGQDDSEVGPMTELSSLPIVPQWSIRIRRNQVTRWAEGKRDGPAGVITRQRIMSLLNKQV